MSSNTKNLRRIAKSLNRIVSAEIWVRCSWVNVLFLQHCSHSQLLKAHLGQLSNYVKSGNNLSFENKFLALLLSVEQTFLNTIQLHPQGSGIWRRRKERNTKNSIYCKISFYTSVFHVTLGLYLLPPGNKAKFKRMKTLCLISRSMWDISGTTVLPWFKKA